MIFEGGPGGGETCPGYARGDQGGALIISNEQKVGEQKSESRVQNAVTPYALRAVADIYVHMCLSIYIYIYIYVYIYIYRYIHLQ